MDAAIIVASKRSPRKSARAIQAGLLVIGSLPSQRTMRRRLFSVNLKSYRPARKPSLSAKNIADHLTSSATSIKSGLLNSGRVLCFLTKHKYHGSMPSVDM